MPQPPLRVLSLRLVRPPAAAHCPARAPVPPLPLPHAGPSRARPLHTTAPRAARTDHYASLHLPRNATKQQVKARFYELSKKFHPDAAGGSADKFHTINDAYAVLGDDDKRRAYDTSLSPAPHTRPSAGPHRSWGARPPPRAPSFSRRHAPDLGHGMGMSGSASGFADPSRGRGRAPGGGPGGQGGQGGPSFAGPSASPRAPPLSWGRTSGGYMRRDRAGDRDDEVKGESAAWRFVVVFGVLLVVVGLGGGFTAKADEGDGGADGGAGAGGCAAVRRGGERDGEWVALPRRLARVEPAQAGETDAPGRRRQ